MDGYISNELYVGSPGIGKCRVTGWSSRETQQMVAIPFGNAIKEVKPGRYAFTMDSKDYDYGESYMVTAQDNTNQSYYVKNRNCSRRSLQASCPAMPMATDLSTRLMS